MAFKNDPENGYYRMWKGIHLYNRREYEKSLKILKMATTMEINSEYKNLAEQYIAKCKKENAG